MADLKYSVDIDTRRAAGSLNSLQRTIAGFGSAIAGAFAFREFTRVAGQFEDLRKTLQTLYGTAEQGAGAFKDIQTIANSLGIDIETLAQSVIKLKAAGIEPTAAQLRLFADVASVSTDKVGALTAMTDLFTRTMGGGLGLEELERLQDRGIPVYDILIQKLGKSRLELSEFGKTARGAEVIRAALSEGLSERFGGAAADRANTLTAAMSRLTNSFKQATDVAGQAGLSQAITDIANTFSTWIKANDKLVKAISVNLAGAFKYFLNNIATISKAMLILFGTIFAVKAIQGINALITGFALLSKTLLRHPIFLIAAGLIAAASAMGLLDGAMKAVNDQFNKFGDTAVVPVLGEIKEGVDDTAKSFDGLVIQQGKAVNGQRDFKKEIEALNEKMKIFRQEMANVTIEFKRQNEETRKNLELDTALIGASSLVAAQKRAEADIAAKLADEIAKLQVQKSKLTEQEIKEGRAGVIDTTIEKLKAQAAADTEATRVAIANSEARKQAYALEQYQLQNRINFEDDLMRIQKEMAQGTMTEIEKKYDDIRRAADASALSAIRAEEARIGRRLNTEEVKKYYEESRKYSEQLITAQARLTEQSRSFETGWTRAWKQYAEDATNAARVAQDIFQKATKGMEDSIVGFAKTGKFEFKSFVADILETLLRSQIQQTMAKVFSLTTANSGGGSILGNLGKLLGFAGGGIIPTNAPVVVGEKGPELLVNAAGNRVIPNNQLGGATQVVYNINAVDAPSFQALVARDPGFIHAVAMAGAGQTAGRR